MRLKDKVAVITGGSRGIGFATVERFLQEGATVILTASSQSSADQAVAKLKEKYPQASVAGISPELTSLNSVQAAFRNVVDRYGRLDILVNNAGVSESTPLLDYTEETYDRVMDLNVKGVFNAARAAAEHMARQGEGQPHRSTQRLCLSRFQVCGERTDGFPGQRAWPQGHPGQRRCPRYHGNGYDEGGPQGGHRADDRPNPPAAAWSAGGYCQCLRVPGFSGGVLHHRCGAECGRHGKVLTKNSTPGSFLPGVFRH